MADEQKPPENLKGIDPSALQQAKEAGARAQGSDVREVQQAPGEQSPQQNLPRSQEVTDRKNKAFGENLPSYNDGKAGRQDVTENLRPPPAQPSTPAPSHDGSTRFAGAAPMAADQTSQAQPVAPPANSPGLDKMAYGNDGPPAASAQQAPTQDGTTRFAASQPPQSQGQTQDPNRGR